MFNQTHRRIKITDKKVRRYYLDSSQFEKATRLRTELQICGFVPKVVAINKKQKYIDEERIIYKEQSVDFINKKSIKLIAQALRELHSIDISASTKNLLVDDFTRDFYYHPYYIFTAGLKSLPPFVAKRYKKYEELARELEKSFFKLKPILSVIHGDVSLSNLLLSEDGLKLIDWDDCRLDLPLVDVYGFFYNFKLGDRWQSEFWKTYGKPTYWSKKLDWYFKIVHEMFAKAPENISVIIPTHNRCPYKRVCLNPLYSTVTSLVPDMGSNIVKQFIIADDCSTDNTYETFQALEKKYKTINFTYIKNKKRSKASFTRQKAIDRSMSQLFLMTDDDCIFPKGFLNRSYELFKTVRQLDRNVAILNFPYVNKSFEFNGSIPSSQYGKIDLKNHWAYHNFDKIPEGVEDLFVKIDTFEGIFLGVKDKIKSAGGYENLSDFVIDYAEHIGLSWRLALKGFSFYSAVGKRFLVSHLKYGERDSNLNINNIPKKYRAVVKRANKSTLNTGDRMSRIKTLESLISSFTYFYFCVSKADGYKHIKKEFDYLGSEIQAGGDVLEAYKNGIHTALRVSLKKGLISDNKIYVEYLNQILRADSKSIRIKLLR